MSLQISRRKFLLVGLVGASLSSSGCGTILYPERRGQPAGPLDWKVVALDAVGLLLFFIPGVIAFAVDFSNGTIYLPSNRISQSVGKRRSLRAVAVSREHLSRERIETVVTAEIGRPIRLTEGMYHTAELDSLDDFDVAADRMVASYEPTHVGQEILRAQSP